MKTTALIPYVECSSYSLTPLTKLHLCRCYYHRERNITQPWLKVKNKPVIKPIKSDLWVDYYSCKKPACSGCIQQEIKPSEYKFCSKELLAPIKIYDERGIKVVATFKEIYACSVYHWVKYQGGQNAK